MKKRTLKMLLAAATACAMLLPMAACKPATPSTSSTASKQDSSTSKEDLYYNTDTYTPICDKTITITVTGKNLQTNHTDWDDILTVKEYEKRLGIKWDSTTYSADEWDTKFTLMLSGDQLPDLIYASGVDAATVLKYGAQDYFLDIAKYIDLMPATQKYFQKYPEYKGFLTTAEGNIWGFTALNVRGECNRGEGYTALNGSWLTKLGIEKPTTQDQFYQMLVAFRDKDANGNGDTTDEIPLLFSPTLSGGENALRYSFGLKGNQYTYNCQVDKNSKVYLEEMSDNYKDYMKFMAKLYKEGLINQDAFVISDDEMEEKVEKNQTGAMFGSDAYWLSLYDQYQWTEVAGMASSYTDNKQCVSLTPTVGNAYNFLVSANTKYPEAICRFADYLHTDEGAMTTLYGYEGITFEWQDVCGYNVANMAAHSQGYDSANVFQWTIAMIKGGCLCAVVPGTSFYPLEELSVEKISSTEYPRYNKITTAHVLAYRTTKDLQVQALFPTVAYTEDEASKRATLYNDVNTYLKTMKASFITGSVDVDTGWAEYISKLKTMHVEDLIAIEQAAYSRLG